MKLYHTLKIALQSLTSCGSAILDSYATKLTIIRPKLVPVCFTISVIQSFTEARDLSVDELLVNLKSDIHG